MKSPVDSEVDLEPVEIEPGLSVYRCPSSGGVWIPLQSYLAWRENVGPAATGIVSATAAAPSDHQPAGDQGRRALLCPESGRVMIRYKVGHGLRFHVERSPVTGGVWLDVGEWEALKAHGLHTELHLIFTASYQRNVRAAGYEDQLADTFRDRIGTVDFLRVLEFKRWMLLHPRRRDISCFLADGIE